MKSHGIDNTDELLSATADGSGRRKLAEELGIADSDLTELINRADLARIKGIAGVYADLLEYAGVDSVKELAHRVPANLHAKLEEANKEHKLTTRVPNEAQVEAWVAEAKSLAKG
jgi:hypothetical protein